MSSQRGISGKWGFRYDIGYDNGPFTLFYHVVYATLGSIMEKTPKAVALKYDREKDKAPKVVAKGRGEVAEKIIEIAKAYNLPLYEDKNLVQILEALELEAEIPPELYRAIAEVLAFIYKLNGKA